MLFQNKRAAAFAQTMFVAVENGFEGVVEVDLERARATGNSRARGETHEIERVRHRIRFIKIIYAPDESTVLIAPGTKIFDVQVSDGQHVLRCTEFVDGCGPMLHPAVKRRA